MDDKFHERLAQAIAWQDVTYAEVAANWRISAQAVDQWVKGKSKPKSERLRRLAQFLHVDEQWLAWGIGDPRTGSVSTATVPDNDSENSVARFDKQLGREVPLVVLEDIPVSRQGVDVSKLTYISDKIRTQFACSQSSLAFVMRDRSMEPKIDQGDIVVIDPELQPVPGDLVLVHLLPSDQKVFRKLSYGMNGEVNLVAINTSWASFKFTAEEWRQNAILIGVMSEHTSPRRT